MKIKTLFAVLLAAVCAVMFPVSSSGEVILTADNCEEIAGVYNYGDNDFLTIYISGGNYHIALTDGENISIFDTEIFADTNAVSYNGRYVYFFQNIIEDDIPGVKICRYDCGHQSKRYSVINTGIKILQGSCAADSSGNFYFIDGREVKVFRDYTLAESLYIENVPLKLVPSCSGDSIYCITARELAVIDDGSVYDIPVRTDMVYAGDGVFSDSSGTVYSYDGTVLCDRFGGCHGSVEYNGVYFGISSGSIVQVSGEKEITLCEMNESAFLCMGNDRFIAVDQNGSNAEIRFFDNRPKEEPPAVSSSGNADSEEIKSSFSLDRFVVKENYLCGIPPETTIAEIKKLLDPKNCTVGFYSKDNSEKKSGTVGTGCSVNIKADEEYGYVIIVYGDLSGEGSINTTDRRLLMKSFLQKETLGKYSAEAADITHDGKTDLKDLAALNFYINGSGDISQDPNK